MTSAYSPRSDLAVVQRLLAAAVAAVWLHQGVWAKVLSSRRSGHEAIVAGVPFVGPERARGATAAIGVTEAGLAVWVLSGRAPVHAAVTQTAALAVMNIGGLLFSPQRITSPERMLLRNAGFITAVWALAVLRRSR